MHIALPTYTRGIVVIDIAICSAPIQYASQTHLFLKLDITAYWWKDNSIGGQDNGNYLTYCCIDMTARDFLKIGQLLLNDGLWNSERILSSAYVQQLKDLTTYGLKFWYTPEAAFSSPNPSFNKLISAVGFDGQYVFIDFENKMLVSRNSLSPLASSIQPLANRN